MGMVAGPSLKSRRSNDVAKQTSPIFHIVCTKLLRLAVISTAMALSLRLQPTTPFAVPQSFQSLVVPLLSSAGRIRIC